MQLFLDNAVVIAVPFALLLIVIKNTLEIKRCTSKKTVPCSIILLLTALILLMPLFMVCLCICALYRQAISLILTLKYGSKFAGLVKGADALHTTGEPSESVVHGLMIIQCIKKRSPDDFFFGLRKVVWKFTQYSKFRMIFLKAFGYSYMLREEVTMNDCIKKMKTINCQNTKMEKAVLNALLNECCNVPLPKNESLSWEVLIGTQPVNWEDDENQYFPVLLRFNHAVADGVTLMKLLAGTLADKQDVKIVSLESSKQIAEKELSKSHPVSSNIYRNNQTTCKEMHQIFTKHLKNIGISFYNRTRKILELLMMGFYGFLLAPASLVVTIILKGNDDNILHGPRLTRQKILAFGSEKSQDYFQKTKRIKNKVPGTSFPEVLLTAYSASLTDYFIKYSASPPKYITVAVPVLHGSSELRRLIPGASHIKNVGNGYSSLSMTLPVVYKNRLEKDTTLINRLKVIKEESNILKNSVDYQVNYFMMSVVCSTLPHPAVKLLFSRSHCTAIFSAFAGPPKVTYCRGSMLASDLMAWVPHLYNIGTTIAIITYNGRLQIGLSADKGVIADQDAAQSIVDGIYKYLDLLEKEVNSVYLKNE